MKGGGLNLHEDDGLSLWMRAVIKKYFILRQLRGALSAESFDALTEDEYSIVELIVQEMSTQDDTADG